MRNFDSEIGLQGFKIGFSIRIGFSGFGVRLCDGFGAGVVTSGSEWWW